MQTQYSELSNVISGRSSQQNDENQMQIDDSGFYPVLKRQKESIDEENVEIQFGKTLAKICAFFRETPLTERDESITHLLDVLSPIEMDKLDDFITNLENRIYFFRGNFFCLKYFNAISITLFLSPSSFSFLHSFFSSFILFFIHSFLYSSLN